MAGSVAIRPLRDADLDSAIDLVSASIAEIPLFQWLLGSHLTEPDVCRWMAAFLLTPHATIGRVESAVTGEGTVDGVVVWSGPDLAPAPLPGHLQHKSARVLSTRPDLLHRLQAVQTITTDERLPGQYVEILLGAVAPSLRRTGVPADLALRARRSAADAGLGIAMSTTDPALGRAHERTYGAVLQKQFPLGAVTTFSYLVSPDENRAAMA